MMHSIVTEVLKEGEDVFTLKFESDISPKPGQFAMLWVPGGKEVPMSFSSVENPLSFTFKVFGETTRSLSKIRKGERLFYRGPYGNSYPEPKGKVAYVGGGTGVASLNTMLHKYQGDVYVGARTRSDLLFVQDDFKVATEDGSFGWKGTVVDMFLPYSEKYDYIFICGPEMMMKSLAVRMKYRQSAKVYMSLERLMKCGIGICDSCSINGFRVCKDGTIFGIEEIKNMAEFGILRRTESGKMELFVNNHR